MNQGIKEFNEIIQEAAIGETTLEKSIPLVFNTYGLGFTDFENKTICNINYPDIFIPNLIIGNRRKLDIAIEEFIKEGTKFYNIDEQLQNKNKYLLHNALQNTLLQEFDNIIDLFLRYLNFFKNERLTDYLTPKNIGYSTLLCGNIIINISKENIDSVTPLSFHISIERMINNQLFYYDFPSIKYGISSSSAYIFEFEEVEERNSINENKEYLQELKTYQTTIDNLLNKAIKTTEINNKEIFVLAAFIQLINLRGIKEIIVPTVLINKTNGLILQCHNNMAKLNKNYEEASKKEDTINLEKIVSQMSVVKNTLDKHPKIIEDRNIKLIKNFKYLEEIYSNYKISDFPMQKDTNLHFHIIDNSDIIKNTLLQDLTKVIMEYEKTNTLLKEQIK